MNPTLPERLRTATEEVRRKSYPLSDLIPLMQEAADALEVQKPVLFPLDIVTRHILGKPNFACGYVAERMRKVLGHTIPTKAEEEQAAVIYFCLGHYLKHGAEWAVHADAELNGDRKPA